MTSKKQIEANKRNAKLGGVKTEKGKEKSKMNAVKHGILSKELLIRHLDNSENDKLELKNLIAEIQNEPKEAMKKITLDRIVSSYWKLRRIQKAEKSVLFQDGVRLRKELEDLYDKQAEKMFNNPADYDWKIRFLNFQYILKLIKTLDSASLELEIYKKIKTQQLRETLHNQFRGSAWYNYIDELFHKEAPLEIKQKNITKIFSDLWDWKKFDEQQFNDDIEILIPEKLVAMDEIEERFSRYETTVENHLYKAIDKYLELDK